MRAPEQFLRDRENFHVVERSPADSRGNFTERLLNCVLGGNSHRSGLGAGSFIVRLRKDDTFSMPLLTF